jgi:hypothetical protein
MPTLKTSLSLAALAALALAVPGPGAAAESPFAGSWKGAIESKPNKIHVDIAVDFLSDPKSGLRGYIDVIDQGIKGHPLEGVEARGSRLEFTSKDDVDTGVFKGEMTNDGTTINGTLVEAGRIYQVTLTRAKELRLWPGEEEPPALHALARGGGELKKQFNQDAGKVRLLLLLAPSSGRCVGGARLVQQKVLGNFADPRVRVYVVWSAIRPGDDRQAAVWAKRHLSDPRALHFWAADSALARGVESQLALKSPNVYLLFGPEAVWEQKLPPATAVMHNLDEGEAATRLDGAKLSPLVGGLLQRMK